MNNIIVFPSVSRKEREQRYKSKLPFRRIINNIQARSKIKNIPCTLNIAWAKKTYTGFCSVTNIPFKIIKGMGSANPYHPSVDRINPKLGYIAENCRWVLLCVNSFKGSGDDKMMMHVAGEMLKHNIKQRALSLYSIL